MSIINRQKFGDQLVLNLQIVRFTNGEKVVLNKNQIKNQFINLYYQVQNLESVHYKYFFKYKKGPTNLMDTWTPSILEASSVRCLPLRTLLNK